MEILLLGAAPPCGQRRGQSLGQTKPGALVHKFLSSCKPGSVFKILNSIFLCLPPPSKPHLGHYISFLVLFIYLFFENQPFFSLQYFISYVQRSTCQNRAPDIIIDVVSYHVIARN